MPGLRVRLSHLDDVGRRAAAVRHPAADLGHALQLAAGAAVGGFFGVVDGDLPDPGLPAAAARAWCSAPWSSCSPRFPASCTGCGGCSSSCRRMRPVAGWLYEHLGWIPFFGTTLSGPGHGAGRLVLAIMILPTVAAISQDALRLVPYRVKEAAYGHGRPRVGSDPQGHAARPPPPASSARSCSASAARSARRWPWRC